MIPPIDVSRASRNESRSAKDNLIILSPDYAPLGRAHCFEVIEWRAFTWCEHINGSLLYISGRNKGLLFSRQEEEEKEKENPLKNIKRERERERARKGRRRWGC